jgi:hypothetical protein
VVPACYPCRCLSWRAPPAPHLNPCHNPPCLMSSVILMLGWRLLHDGPRYLFFQVNDLASRIALRFLPQSSSAAPSASGAPFPFSFLLATTLLSGPNTISQPPSPPRFIPSRRRQRPVLSPLSQDSAAFGVTCIRSTPRPSLIPTPGSFLRVRGEAEPSGQLLIGKKIHHRQPAVPISCLDIINRYHHASFGFIV